jgi:Uma2 family endonuclease
MVTTRFTRADYMALPEGYPAELVRGSLVRTPAPRYGHQRAVGRLHRVLCGIVDPDRVVMSPIDVFVDDLNVLQPDVAVLRDVPSRDAAEIGIPLLVVEVLSPSTERRDRESKRRVYLRAGVEEVWLVDPDRETIDVWRKEGVESFAPDEVAASRTIAGFSISGRSLLA